MEAYLDNSSTTRCYDEVRDLMVRTLVEDFGNPSSMHRKGVEAEAYVREARERIARTLKADAREVYFTSGGTESNNWALIGTALANARLGKHIVTTAIEHPAVSEPAAFLESQGYCVTRLPVDERGLISLDDLRQAIRPDTILVSVMYVNNEIGTVQPIARIAETVKACNPRTYFHVDAIQAYGKFRIWPKRMGVDMLSASGHKIHGPKGIGFLYISDKVKIFPYIYGGGQQKGMRSGTDNVPGAAGFGLAASMVYEHLEEDTARIRSLRDALVAGLCGFPGVTIHGAGLAEEERAPHIVSAAFAGVRSEVLLHALEDRGVYVSAGSACSTHKKNHSPTLSAIGLPAASMDSTVRFSLCDTTTKEEIDMALAALGELLPVLRRYARK